MSERSPTAWETAVRQFSADPANAIAVKQNYFDAGVVRAAARYSRSSEYRAISRIIGRGPGRALDIGAGRGVTAYALARIGWKVTAIDPDPSDQVGIGAVRQFPGMAPGSLTALLADGEHLPLAEESIDLVFGRQVLHHLVDLAAGLAEVRRVLRTSGRVLFVREHVADDETQLAAFLAGHPLHQMYGGEHAYPLQQYLSAFSDAGLTVTRVYGPLDSMINFYPGGRVRRVAKVAWYLAGGHQWSAIVDGDRRRRILETVSCEPGRLYSFLAEPR